METAKDLIVDHLHGYNGVTEKIKRAMYDAAKQFVYIGFLLKEVRDYGYYEEAGFNNVYQYAEFELGFKRSSTKNFIAITETFGIQEYSYHGAIRKQQTMSLQPQYEKFNYSQLVELLAMSETKREKASPDMTVKQLRELKRDPDPTQMTIEDLEISGQTSGQVTDEYGKGITGKTIKDPEPGKWYDNTWQKPAAYDRKLKLVIIEYNPHNKQFGIGYYNTSDEQWHDQSGNRIKVTHWMVLPHMPTNPRD